jgi:hypothetical protein
VDEAEEAEETGLMHQETQHLLQVHPDLAAQEV